MDADMIENKKETTRNKNSLIWIFIVFIYTITLIFFGFIFGAVIYRQAETFLFEEYYAKLSKIVKNPLDYDDIVSETNVITRYCRKQNETPYTKNNVFSVMQYSDSLAEDILNLKIYHEAVKFSKKKSEYEKIYRYLIANGVRRDEYEDVAKFMPDQVSDIVKLRKLAMCGMENKGNFK